MTIEHELIAHYRHGDLEDALMEAIAAAGKDPDKLTADDLAPADEFHVGGRPATIDLAKTLAPHAGMHLLDIGAGLGGPSRYFAQTFGCRVSGVDLSEEYVTVARSLSRRVGLDCLVDYWQASALDLPFADASFDAAYMQHVGMNIADKPRLFDEVHRVLKPGGMFGIYDIMGIDTAPLKFPLPWASSAEISFVEAPARYRALLGIAGFEIVREHDWAPFALDFYRKLKARAAAGGTPPALSLHVIIGPTAPQRIGNMVALLEQGTVAPVEMISRRIDARHDQSTV
ncbi:MAG: class I SAM-dependent methyltransferase [Xanthobacteraceae bacterium]